MTIFAKVLFWIGLVWLMVAAAANNFAVHISLMAITSDYMDQPLTKVQTNAFIDALHDKVGQAPFNVGIPIVMILVGFALRFGKGMKLDECRVAGGRAVEKQEPLP